MASDEGKNKKHLKGKKIDQCRFYLFPDQEKLMILNKCIIVSRYNGVLSQTKCLSMLPVHIFRQLNIVSADSSNNKNHTFQQSSKKLLHT